MNLTVCDEETYKDSSDLIINCSIRCADFINGNKLNSPFNEACKTFCPKCFNYIENIRLATTKVTDLLMTTIGTPNNTTTIGTLNNTEGTIVSPTKSSGSDIGFTIGIIVISIAFVAAFVAFIKYYVLYKRKQRQNTPNEETPGENIDGNPQGERDNDEPSRRLLPGENVDADLPQAEEGEAANPLLQYPEPPPRRGEVHQTQQEERRRQPQRQSTDHVYASLDVRPTEPEESGLTSQPSSSGDEHFTYPLPDSGGVPESTHLSGVSPVVPESGGTQLSGVSPVSGGVPNPSGGAHTPSAVPETGRAYFSEGAAGTDTASSDDTHVKGRAHQPAESVGASALQVPDVPGGNGENGASGSNGSSRLQSPITIPTQPDNAKMSGDTMGDEHFNLPLRDIV